MSDIKAGDVFTVTYPFIRTTYSKPDFYGEGGDVDMRTWKPGCDYRAVYPDDNEGYCHAEGQMELTVVEVFKPGKYPTRVFFTRQWISPEGKRFGKKNLRIMTSQAFLRRTKGWFADSYIVDPEEA